ncbi:MAG: hypothetical protein WA860_01685 [Acidimicrobiales bacterium]
MRKKPPHFSLTTRNLPPIKLATTAKPDEHDPDELVGLDIEPEQAIKGVLDGAGAEDEEVEMDEPVESEAEE